MATFTPVDLSALYTHSRDDASSWDEKTAWGVARLPGGQQRFWGVPFGVGSAEPDAPGLLVIGSAGSRQAVRVPLDGAATYVVFAHLCDARASTTVAGQTSDYPNPVVTAPGEHLADYVIEYADGAEHRVPVRRRFEVNQVMSRMQSGFMSRPHFGLTPLPMRGPYPVDSWGRYQTGASVGPAGRPAGPRDDLRGRTHPSPSWSIYALPNPEPEKPLRGLRLEPTGAAAIGVGALTLFHGAHHPLRHERLESLRVTLPPEAEIASAAESAEIDLGVIARRYEASPVEEDAWLGAAVKGRARCQTSRQWRSCSTSPAAGTPL